MTEMTARLSAALADRYRIEGHLGEGGMATVYLAEDLKHKRKVAVKVLRPELAAVLGAERFVQEITTTANLQHPHILPLFDSGEADSFLYYVMPFIDGETLRDKLDRETQLGIEEAVKITTEVADALDYAHRNNVIHRDIKPENILLHDGRPMVADFGIALAVSAAAGGRMTETGLSLGTPHYMSPEQATAEKDLTNRSDIYSLGAVLYEMLTGDPPHTGSSAQQVIMKIVTDDVRPVTELRKAVPLNVAFATAKALEKLPADRFGSARELAGALADSAFRTQLAAAGAAAVRRTVPQLGWIVATSVLAVVAVLGWWPRGEAGADPTRFVLPPDPQVMIAGARAGGSSIVISPDGRTIVWRGPGATLGIGQLYRRRLDRLDAEPIAGTEGAEGPFFSPNGQWVGFYTSTALRKVPLDGGPPVTITSDIVTNRGEAYWADDGFVYLNHVEAEAVPGRLIAEGVARVDASGGTLQLLDREQAIEREVRGFEVLPGGRWLLYADCEAWTCNQTSAPRIVAKDLRSDETVLMLENAAWPRVLASGHLLFIRDGTLFAVPFDGKPQLITDRPVALPLSATTLNPAEGVNIAVARNGTMVYLPGGELRSAHLVVVDREGRERQLTSRPDAFAFPRVDPTGRRIAVTIGGAEQQIWIYDVRSSTLSQFTIEGQNERATWSPNGRALAFSSLRDGRWSVYRRPADASAPATALDPATLSDLRITPFWSPTGEWVLTDQLVGDASSTDEITAVSTTGAGLQVLMATPSRETVPAVSPDSRWLAYVSDVSGPEEVYVTSFMSEGGQWQVSDANGDMPLWLSSKELVYIASDRTLTLVELDFTEGVSVVNRTSLFSVEPYSLDANAWPYDVMPGSEEFVFVLRGAREATPVVVLNWFEALREAFEDRQ